MGIATYNTVNYVWKTSNSYVKLKGKVSFNKCMSVQIFTNRFQEHWWKLYYLNLSDKVLRRSLPTFAPFFKLLTNLLLNKWCHSSETVLIRTLMNHTVLIAIYTVYYLSSFCERADRKRHVIITIMNSKATRFVMAAHSNGQTIIFCRYGFYLSSFFFFFPRLHSAVGDWMSTIPKLNYFRTVDQRRRLGSEIL